eukprot:scaffold73856_cov44-Phaeocystis_antarctica.AAC.3
MRENEGTSSWLSTLSGVVLSACNLSLRPCSCDSADERPSVRPSLPMPSRSPPPLPPLPLPPPLPPPGPPPSPLQAGRSSPPKPLSSSATRCSAASTPCISSSRTCRVSLLRTSRSSAAWSSSSKQ